MEKGMIKGFAPWVVLTAVCMLSISSRAQDLPQKPVRSITLLDAVQSTLENHPSLKIQQAQVDISRGARQQAAAPFDFAIQSGLFQSRTNNPLTAAQQAQAGFPITNDVADLSTYSLQGTQLFRNGVSITPSFGLARNADNVLALTGTNTSSMSLLVTIPLMQGRGRKAVTAAETAAFREVDATQLDEAQLVAQLMAGTAVSYWNLVAAYKSLAIAADSEQRGRQYRDNVQALIDADAVPHNDLNEVAANLSQREATRIAAQQQVIAAQQQLSLDMGADAAGMFFEFGPADDFPDGGDQKLPPADATALQGYLDNALQNRGDYRAAQARQSESSLLLAGAQNKVLPQVNLNFGTGYVGLQEGRQLTSFFAPFYSGMRGPNATLGITYTFPVANSAARGQLLQAHAATRQAELHAGDVARNISASIVTALGAVRHSLLQLKSAQASVEAFQAALAGEQEKYRLGNGSVVDILTVEDRLTNALLNQVQAQLAYAQAITQFRFATGTLISPDQPTQKVPSEIFRTLPAVVWDQATR